jgi:hypothetical protein
MTKYVLFLFFCFSVTVSAQKSAVQNKKISPLSTEKISTNPDLAKINDSVAALIPYKKDGKFGFISQAGKVVIKPVYSNVGFFTEDCNLLNSPNPNVKKYGSAEYASVRYNENNYRVNKHGKRVYLFKDADLGKCQLEYRPQLFHAYVMNYAYGIIEDARFSNPGNYNDFTIYPQYDYLHILEGDDLKNPMIIAAKNNKFGIIDVHNNVIIPFIYSDIKRNFSWKLARLFEVTTDGRNYFYIDADQKRY